MGLCSGATSARSAPGGHIAPPEATVTKAKRSGAWYRRAKRERDALTGSLGIDPILLAPAKPGPKPDDGRVAALRKYLAWRGEPDQENLQLPQEPKHRALALLGNPSRAWLRRKSSLRIVAALEAHDAAADPIGFALWQDVRVQYRKFSKKTFRRDVARIQTELWGAPHEASVGDWLAGRSGPTSQ
jgi:hypothetical protein